MPPRGAFERRLKFLKEGPGAGLTPRPAVEGEGRTLAQHVEEQLSSEGEPPPPSEFGGSSRGSAAMDVECEDDDGRFYVPPEDRQALREFLWRLVSALDEKNFSLFERVVCHCGLAACQDLLDQTKEILKNGGILIPGTERRKSPGGVFLSLLKQRLPAEEIEKIWKEQNRRQAATKADRRRKMAGIPKELRVPTALTRELNAAKHQTSPPARTNRRKRPLDDALIGPDAAQPPAKKVETDRLVDPGSFSALPPKDLIGRDRRPRRPPRRPEGFSLAGGIQDERAAAAVAAIPGNLRNAAISSWQAALEESEGGEEEDGEIREEGGRSSPQGRSQNSLRRSRGRRGGASLKRKRAQRRKAPKAAAAAAGDVVVENAWIEC